MNAHAIVDAMMSHDAFSQWIGVEVLNVDLGSCTIRAIIRPDMVNGFGICHGGVTFSIADSAFAFASNSRGSHAVSIETSISHHKPAQIGDVITAQAKEIHVSNRLARYEVSVTNQNNALIAHFKGTVFVTERVWE
jgi:acyl-CoA thioesterase